ncbi:adhesion G-protein coupled receptor G4 [Stomoxys calcitrans]|uniref:adhesion G-protein coupled receptor G4 n=1 Tax=Stomoxys calcitrans TaxID=35570 RepID=UPI0027E23B7C|nr:adhesion G-protein coupled receptor G4 [Stomoxys calcitrans]
MYYSIWILITIFAAKARTATQWCEKDIYPTELRSVGKQTEGLAIWSPIRAGGHRLLTLCSNVTGLPVERHCAFDYDSPTGKWEFIDRKTTFLSCDVIHNDCKEEIVKQFFLRKNGVKVETTNRLLPGKLGEYSPSQKVCLQSTGLPLSRRCIYNARHYKAEWDNKIVGNSYCLQDINQEIITGDLNRLYLKLRNNTNNGGEENLLIATQTSALLAKAKTSRIAADLKIATDILEILAQQDHKPELMAKILEIANHLMECDENVVRMSQPLDIPNRLIKILDNYYDRTGKKSTSCGTVPNGVHYSSVQYTTVFQINPACANISGIAVYRASAHPTASMLYDATTQRYFRFINMYEEIKDIIRDPHIEVATYFPRHVWTAIQEDESNVVPVDTITISLYRNKNFFMDEDHLDDAHEPDSVILSSSVPGYKGGLIDSVPLLLKYHRKEEDQRPTCRYWNSTNWISDASVNTTTVISDTNDYLMCKSIQLLPLAAVWTVQVREVVQTNTVVLTLRRESTVDMVSVVGCGLSLLVLIFIWMTALCCSHWRSDISNKLLFNLCFVLSLIMVYLLLANMWKIKDAMIDISNRHYCIAMGAFLQYTILVLFLWMLFIAYLQYRRYVAVVGVVTPSHFVAKYALAAWGLPLLPTIMLVYLDPKTYAPMLREVGNDNSLSAAMCFPTGYALYATVVFPVVVIILVNFIIFLYVLCSVRKSLQKYKRNQHRQEMTSQVWLTLLLFLLLCMTLAFGILAYAKGSLLYSFLFCLTVTVQGFMLFIYFVVIDKFVRFKWLSCCYPKDYNVMDDTIMSPLSEY